MIVKPRVGVWYDCVCMVTGCDVLLIMAVCLSDCGYKLLAVIDFKFG